MYTKNCKKKANSGEIISRWINIRYNYMPKYCRNYNISWDKESECYILHPELYPNKEGEDDGK